MKVSDSSTTVIWTASRAALPERRRVKSKPAIPTPRTRMRVDGWVISIFLSLSEKETGKPCGV